MEIIAYTALHYGKSYLASAIRSVIYDVDEYHVLYSPHPSHGSNSGRPCPDSESELHDIAWQTAGTKLQWHVGDWQHEGQQRDSIHQYAPDADVIIIVDSDEIYPFGLVHALIDQTSAWHRRYIRVPFVHFYRDFEHCIIHDPSYPIRVIYPHTREGEATAQSRPIVHMGYCQPAETIRYKLGIHGHRNELRCSPDEYVDKIYLDYNRWTDLHPVGSEYWNTEIVDPLDYLPRWMNQHPFYELDVVR